MSIVNKALAALALAGLVGAFAVPHAIEAADASATATTTLAVKAQTTCPIMGGKIDKNVFADYEGKRVYFCCAGCVAEFKKDPATHVKAMEDQGIVLEKTPATTTTVPAK